MYFGMDYLINQSNLIKDKSFARHEGIKETTYPCPQNKKENLNLPRLRQQQLIKSYKMTTVFSYCLNTVTLGVSATVTGRLEL